LSAAHKGCVALFRSGCGGRAIVAGWGVGIGSGGWDTDGVAVDVAVLLGCGGGCLGVGGWSWLLGEGCFVWWRTRIGLGGVLCTFGVCRVGLWFWATGGG